MDEETQRTLKRLLENATDALEDNNLPEVYEACWLASLFARYAFRHIPQTDNNDTGGLVN